MPPIIWFGMNRSALPSWKAICAPSVREIVPVPKDAPPPISKRPPLICVGPVKVYPAASSRVPLPAFVIPKLPPLTTPSTASVPVSTVTTRSEPRETAPTPKLKLFGPLNEKSPFQYCGFCVAKATEAPEVFPSVPPVSHMGPVPRGEADALPPAFRLSCPCASVVPPECVLRPLKVTVPTVVFTSDWLPASTASTTPLRASKLLASGCNVPFRTVPPLKTNVPEVLWWLPPRSSTPPSSRRAPLVESGLTPPRSNSVPEVTVVPPV